MDNIMTFSFQNRELPHEYNLVGYSWLLNHFNVTAPLRTFSAISTKRLSSQTIQKEGWLIFDSSYQIENHAYSHLKFAIKYEVIDLLILKLILKHFPKEELTSFISANPKRILSKKIWFYYEFLLDEVLSLEDLPVGKYDDLLDDKKYFAKKNPLKSKRHKINNNLLGTARICPIIQRTKKLEEFVNSTLKTDVSTIVNGISKSLIRRASSFLLLADTQASFEIEGERVTRNRIENWGKIINQAGQKELSFKEIERLHSILLEDSRFVKIGLRDDEVFLGDRDRENRPIPEFIGAKSNDLNHLMSHWVELNSFLMNDEIDPVFHAVVVAFSFVYIHPLEDGNGRIHRYLLHHILAQRDFYPKGLIFPLSSVILDEIEKYRDILVAHTKPLMSMIEWKETLNGNVEILNETIDLYRFFNATESCEFIYEAVKKVIKKTLPSELNYLNAFDKASLAINDIVVMPNNMVKMLITFMVQNGGKLSKRKKEKYFELLSDDEIELIEAIIKEEFRDFI